LVAKMALAFRVFVIARAPHPLFCHPTAASRLQNPARSVFNRVHIPSLPRARSEILPAANTPSVSTTRSGGNISVIHSNPRRHSQCRHLGRRPPDSTCRARRQFLLGAQSCPFHAQPGRSGELYVNGVPCMRVVSPQNLSGGQKSEIQLWCQKTTFP